MHVDGDLERGADALAKRVQMQKHNSRATCWRKPNDAHSVFAPSEVLASTLLSGMEKWDRSLSFWINCDGFGCFVTITALTGQSEVVGDGQAARNARLYVLD